jgi:hypothetical protein
MAISRRLLGLLLLLTLVSFHAMGQAPFVDWQVKRIPIIGPVPPLIASKLQTGSLVQMPRLDFDQMSERISELSDPTLRPRIVQMRFQGKVTFEADGQATVEGTGTGVIQNPNTHPSWLPIDPFSAVLSVSRWQSGEPALLEGNDGKNNPLLQLQCPKFGENRWDFSYSIRPWKDQGKWRFDWTIPNLPSGMIELDVPVGWEPEVDRDEILIKGPSPIADHPSWKRWSARIGGVTQLRWTLKPSDPNQSATTSFFRAKKNTRYDLSADAMRVKCIWDFEQFRTPSRELVVRLDPGLALMEIKWNDFESWQEEPGANGSRLVRMRFRETARLSRLEVQAIGVTPLLEVDPTAIPGIFLKGALPDGERIEIAIDPALQLKDWQSGAFELLSASTTNDRAYTINLQSKGPSDGSTSRPKLLLTVPSPAVYSVQQSLDWVIDPASQKLTSRLAVDLQQGTLNRLPLKVPDGWQWSRVEATPPEIAPTIVPSINGLAELEFARPIVGPVQFQLDLNLELIPRGLPAPVERFAFPDVHTIGAVRRTGKLAWKVSSRYERILDSNPVVEQRDELSFQGWMPAGSIRLRLQPNRWNAESELTVQRTPNVHAFQERIRINPESGDLRSIILGWSSGLIPKPSDWRMAEGNSTLVNVENLNLAPIFQASLFVGANSLSRIVACAPIDVRWQRLRFNQPLDGPTTLEANWFARRDTLSLDSLMLLPGNQNLVGWLLLSSYLQQRQGVTLDPIPVTHVLGADTSTTRLFLREGDTRKIWNETSGLFEAIPKSSDVKSRTAISEANLLAIVASDEVRFRLHLQVNSDQEELLFRLPLGAIFSKAWIADKPVQPRIMTTEDRTEISLPWVDRSTTSLLTIEYRIPDLLQAKVRSISIPWPECPTQPERISRQIRVMDPSWLLEETRRFQQANMSSSWIESWNKWAHPSRSKLDPALTGSRSMIPGEKIRVREWMLSAKEADQIVLDRKASPFLDAFIDPNQLDQYGITSDLVLLHSDRFQLLTTRTQFGLWQIQDYVDGHRITEPTIQNAIELASRLGKDPTNRFMRLENLGAIQFDSTDSVTLPESTEWIDHSPESLQPIMLISRFNAQLMIGGIAVLWFLLMGVFFGRPAFALLTGFLICAATICVASSNIARDVNPLCYLHLIGLLLCVLRKSDLLQRRTLRWILTLVAFGVCWGWLALQAAIPEIVTVYEMGPEVLVPASWLEKMQAAIPKESDSLFVSAEYRGGERQENAEIQGDFNILTRVENCEVVFPIVGLRLREALIDGKKAFPRADTIDRISLRIDQPGMHLIRLRMSAPLVSIGDETELKFSIPETVITKFEFQHDDNNSKRIPTIFPWRGTALWKNGKLQADLGRTRSIQLRWQDEESVRATDIRVVEANWFELSPGSISLQTSSDFRLSQSVTELEWDVPDELELARMDVRLEGNPVVPHSWIRDWKFVDQPGDQKKLIVRFQSAVSGRVRIMADWYRTDRVIEKPTLRVPMARNVVESDRFLAFRLNGVSLVGEVEKTGATEFSSLTFVQEIWRSPIIGPLVVPSRTYRQKGTGIFSVQPNLVVPSVMSKGECEYVYQLDRSTSVVQVLYRFEAITERVPMLEWLLPENWTITEIRAPGMKMWFRASNRLQIWFDQPQQAGNVTWQARFGRENGPDDRPIDFTLPSVLPRHAEIDKQSWQVRRNDDGALQLDLEKGLQVVEQTNRSVQVQSSSSQTKLRIRWLPASEPRQNSPIATKTSSDSIVPQTPTEVRTEEPIRIFELTPSQFPGESWHRLEISIRIAMILSLGLLAWIQESRGSKSVSNQLVVWSLLGALVLEPTQAFVVLVVGLIALLVSLVTWIRNVLIKSKS